jgi:hypothetical protein
VTYILILQSYFIKSSPADIIIIIIIIMESIGIYEYHSKDLIGHGAFAVVYKGRVKMVSGKKSLHKFNFLLLAECYAPRFHEKKL